MHSSRISILKHLKWFGLTLLLLAGCAISPPVQEMSNARQALQAAREVNADVYAPQSFKAAEQLLEAASDNIAEGDYLEAREQAIQAQQHAVKARQKALSEQR